MFGHAHLFYSLQIVELTYERWNAFGVGGGRWPAGLLFYADAQHIYDGLRGIYGFYPQLEREALQNGDAGKAADMAAKGSDLRTVLKDEWSYADQAMIAEVSEVETPIGVPEAQGAFKGAAIDINDLGERLRLWKVMLRVFQKSGSASLALLMGLIGRSLKAYTVHNNYNVRDWGASHLDTVMPTDLAGRAERDCGVYGLMVAWEAFKTLKDADGSANASFKLVAMLDHALCSSRTRIVANGTWSTTM